MKVVPLTAKVNAISTLIRLSVNPSLLTTDSSVVPFPLALRDVGPRLFHFLYQVSIAGCPITLSSTHKRTLGRH